MKSKIPVWLIIRRTFDANINPITLYYSIQDNDLFFVRERLKAIEFVSKTEAQSILNQIIPRHMNEYVMQSESEFVRIL